MKHTSLLDCYKSDTTYLSDDAKMVVLDIITRIDTINQMAKNDVIIYADSQMVVERHILGEVTRWLALWDARIQPSRRCSHTIRHIAILLDGIHIRCGNAHIENEIRNQ